MVKELDNFRKKYPQYNDIDDTKLAGMLASKYPDAYGYLPNLVSAGQIPAEPIIEELPEMVSHQQGVIPEQPQTTAGGVLGAVTRGAAPYAMGAGAGALLGAPVGGVGAVPGALAGTGAVALADVVGDPIVMGVNKLLGTDYTLPSQALSDLFTRMGVPEPDTEAERVVQSTASGAAGAGGFVSLGNALLKSSAPKVKKLGEIFSSQPVSQVVGGATGGATGQLASEADLGVAGELTGAIVGGMAGAKLSSLRNVGVPKVTEDIKNVGVRALTSDVLPPETPQGKIAQVISEKIPFFGTGGVRAAQRKERIEAVKSFLEDYSAINPSETLTDDLMQDFLAKRGEIVNKYVTDKKSIIENVSNAAGGRNYPKTIKTIKDQIAYLENIESPALKPFIKELENLRDTLPGKELSIAESKRKLLGDSLKSEGLANIKSEADKAYSKIYNALNDDMGDTIKIFGGRRGFDKWKVANKRLSQMQEELGVTNIKSVLKKGNYEPEAIGKMLFSLNKSTVNRLYRNLSENGRAMARASIINKVATRSFSGEELSPKKFVNALDKESKSIGVFFTRQERNRVEGLVRALNATKRADLVDSQPLLTSGLQFLSGSALAQLMGSAPEAIGATAGVGAIARIYESRAVRNILTRLPRTTPGSKEEAFYLKRLISALQSQGITENE